MKRVGVIGSVNRDTIIHPDGAVAHALGGILYTALAAAYLGQAQLEVWLLCKIGADAAEEGMPLLTACANLRLEGVEIVPQASFHSRICYRQDGSKQERLTGNIAPLSLAQIAPFLGQLDGLLVNFITGFELELETLKALRSQFPGILLMDVHSLTLGRKPSGERFWQRPTRWQEWLAQADVVQMNEAEAVLLSGMTEVSDGSLRSFARGLLGGRTTAVALTLGDRGVLGACRGTREPQEFYFPAEHPEWAVDPTGCGDVFLAALGVAMLLGFPFPQALQKACRAAGVKSRFQGVAGLDALSRLDWRS